MKTDNASHMPYTFALLKEHEEKLHTHIVLHQDLKPVLKSILALFAILDLYSCKIMLELETNQI